MKVDHNKDEQHNKHQLMMMLPALLLLLSSLAAASQADFPICTENLYHQFYIVFGSPPPPSKAANQQRYGVSFDLYPTACSVYGLRPANITASLVPNLVDLLDRCTPVDPTKRSAQLSDSSMWVDLYEGLPRVNECSSLYPSGEYISDPFICDFGSLPALCQVPNDVVQTISATVSTSATTTENISSLITTVFLSTETVTDYFVTRITTVITQGTSSITTITTTSTSCSTITRTYTITPSCSDSSSSSSSSSNSDCCLPSHRRRREHHRSGCRDFGPKIQHDINNLEGTKVDKAAASPDRIEQTYIQCTTNLNGFYLVQVTQPDSMEQQDPPGPQGSGEKALQRANINGVEACEYFGMTFANVTIPILESLIPIFNICLPGTELFAFNSYYAYTPLCGFVTSYNGFSAYALGFNDVVAQTCDTAEWALCYERAAPIVTTSTIPTGPFTISTVSTTQTNTQFTTETSLITETITEDEILTITSTSFFPVTSTTSTTAATTTVTQTSLSITSCCCNPTVCTTIEECCKPKPTCHKPGCHRPHHGDH